MLIEPTTDIQARRDLLAEREARMERAQQVFFRDFGTELLEIRNAQLYKDGGYHSFEAYCQERWEITHRRANQLIEATETIELVEKVGTRVPTFLPPSSESQVRPLVPLAREDPEAAAEAWSTAVNRSSGQPTMREVQEAVAEVQQARHQANQVDPSGSDRESNESVLNRRRIADRATTKEFYRELQESLRRRILRRDVDLLLDDSQGERLLHVAIRDLTSYAKTLESIRTELRAARNEQEGVSA